MKLLVTDNHTGEGIFPIFPKGTLVKDIVPCEEVPHWYACTINGIATFIPDIFLTEAILNADYNPTELVLAKGDVVELQRVVYEWLYVKSNDGTLGWFPASKIISIDG